MWIYSERGVRYEWDNEEKCWSLAIKPEDRLFLDGMRGRLKRDSSRILDFLEEQDEGYRNTTARLEMEVMKYKTDDHNFLFNLDEGLRLGSIERGLLLDVSHHGFKVEGLPYNLDFYLIKNF